MIHKKFARAYTAALIILVVLHVHKINTGGVMLSQIDTLLGTLSREEKELLKGRFQITLNRSRKPYITGIKDRAKRQTRNDVWTFLSEYYRIIFHAPICDQLHSGAPLTQSDQTDTLLHEKRKGQSTLSTDGHPAPKRPCLTDKQTSFLAGPCVESKNQEWLRKFFEAGVKSSSSSSSSSSTLEQTGCSYTSQIRNETVSLSKTITVSTAFDHTTGHHDPCLLLGLYELFRYKRDLFNKLCTELNI